MNVAIERPNAALEDFASAEAMVSARRPTRPVYCIYPRLTRDMACRLARAKAQGKRIGRPRIAPHVESRIREALSGGHKGVRKIAREHGVGVSTVQRIKAAAS